jgi:hypothetical protein
MANTIITSDMIAKEALMQVKNNMVMGNHVHREYKDEFAKVGSTVSIRKPVKFEAKDGATRVAQDVSETTVPFVINKRKHVSWSFSTQDLTLSIEEYSKRYITPAAIALANQVDADLCDLYKGVHQSSGAAGVTPATFKAFAGASTELNRFAVPMDSRSLVLDTDAELNAADVLKGLYNPGMVEDAVRNIATGRIGNMTTYMDQNIKTHTAGTADANYDVNGADQTGSSINVDTGSGTILEGDLITFASVYSVNPVSRQSTGNLKTFTVTGTTGGATVTNIEIEPAIITSGAYQNVTNAPADGDDVVLTATHQANLAFHRNAFGLVVVPLEMPDGAPFKARQTADNLSIRVLKDYDIDNDEDIIRIDILYGVKDIYPEFACRLLG